jgi:endonuclease/exonuclease/phosphatase (EEP) superfamily protein YafD
VGPGWNGAAALPLNPQIPQTSRATCGKSNRRKSERDASRSSNIPLDPAAGFPAYSQRSRPASVPTLGRRMIRRILRWALLGLGGAALAATALSFLPSNEAWIRIWDFPRLQIAVILAAALILIPFVLRWRRWPALCFAVALAAAWAWQISRIAPYTPAAAQQAVDADSCPDGSRIKLLAANVRVDTKDVAPLRDLVRAVDPDLILLVETDRHWDRGLEPLREDYPYALRQPQENGYGMHLFSRFELIDPQIRFLIEKTVPSIKTGVKLPSGARLDFYGLHPKPPPLQDTDERDAELLLVGKEVADESPPAIVAGDLNDVAWSRTTQLFQEISGLLDPRIGRGPYSTFSVDWPILRWPIDHVFFEQSFFLLDMAVLPDIGSDHFPFFLALCHDPAAAKAQAKPRPSSPKAEAEAEETIREGRAKADSE